MITTFTRTTIVCDCDCGWGLVSGDGEPDKVTAFARSVGWRVEHDAELGRDTHTCPSCQHSLDEADRAVKGGGADGVQEF